MLKVPVGLGDFVHARAAHKDRRRADEDVQAAKRALVELQAETVA